MGSGGGSDDCDDWDIECQAKKAGAALPNIMTQIATGGLVSNENGTFGKGVATRAIDESIGELSGRNLQRKAAMDAKDAIAEEKVARAKQLKDEQTRKFQQDVNASSAAQAARDSSRAATKNYLGATDPEKDFLGL